MVHFTVQWSMRLSGDIQHVHNPALIVPDSSAPGGFWRDGRSYAGSNQSGQKITGSRVA
jgi:hypothetical protein